MLTLCRHCGATQAHTFYTLPVCKACGKRLPLTLPRGLTYAARTFAKPLLILIFAALIYSMWPTSLTAPRPTYLPATVLTDNNPPATQTPR